MAAYAGNRCRLPDARPARGKSTIPMSLCSCTTVYHMAWASSSAKSRELRLGRRSSRDERCAEYRREPRGLKGISAITECHRNAEHDQQQRNNSAKQRLGYRRQDASPEGGADDDAERRPQRTRRIQPVSSEMPASATTIP